MLKSPAMMNLVTYWKRLCRKKAEKMASLLLLFALEIGCFEVPSEGNLK